MMFDYFPWYVNAGIAFAGSMGLHYYISNSPTRIVRVVGSALSFTAILTAGILIGIALPNLFKS